MKTSPDSRTRRKLIALTLSGAILIALVAVGGYGLLTGSRDAPPPRASSFVSGGPRYAFSTGYLAASRTSDRSHK